MRKTVIILTSIVLVIAACTKKNGAPDTGVKPLSAKPFMNGYFNGTDSPFIHIDSANKMLNSYLNSLSSSDVAGELHSLIFDAEALRYYLQDTSIKEVKVMFAHRLDYINNGNANQYAGNSYDAITLVIAGIDGNSNYVYTPAGRALDNALPCPYSCPTSGTASSDLLVK